MLISFLKNIGLISLKQELRQEVRRWDWGDHTLSKIKCNFLHKLPVHESIQSSVAQKEVKKATALGDH